MPSKNKLRIGIIGLGSFAHVARLPLLTSMRNIEMTACMARTPETVNRVARQFGFEKKYTDVEKFREESGIEAAIVSTPKQTHYDIVIPLLEKGIHVFCEKPMAMSISQAEEMVSCARENNLVLMIGFNRRYAPVYDWAKHEFAEQPPDVCVAFKNRPGTEYRATMENAIHMVDLLRFYCGECTEVTAHAKFDNPDYEDSASAILKFESGAVGFLLGNRTCGQWMERVELYGHGKTVTVHCPDSITVVDQEQEHTRKMTPLRSGWATLEEKMGFRQELDAFINAVKQKSPIRTPGSDSIKTHILVNRVLKAAGLPEMNQ